MPWHGFRDGLECEPLPIDEYGLYRRALERLAYAIDNDIQTRGLGRVLADILEDAERYKRERGA